jgi:hypothetical protein
VENLKRIYQTVTERHKRVRKTFSLRFFESVLKGEEEQEEKGTSHYSRMNNSLELSKTVVGFRRWFGIFDQVHLLGALKCLKLPQQGPLTS